MAMFARPLVMDMLSHLLWKKEIKKKHKSTFIENF